MRDVCVCDSILGMNHLHLGLGVFLAFLDHRVVYEVEEQSGDVSRRTKTYRRRSFRPGS